MASGGPAVPPFPPLFCDIPMGSGRSTNTSRLTLSAMETCLRPRAAARLSLLLLGDFYLRRNIPHAQPSGQKTEPTARRIRFIGHQAARTSGPATRRRPANRS